MTMRIAIAGGGGFAYILAREIAQNGNTILVLSTRQHPEFEELGVQVAVVDYSNVQELRYTLRGLDLIVSTIAGNAQLNLIHAARHARVRTFVPSEFEGALAHRPTSDDPLDHGSCAALRLLSEFSQQSNSQSIFNSNSSSPSNPPSPPPPPPLHYTVFSCGVFYERFQPGGLGATLNANIGAGSNVHVPGSFLLNADTAEAEIVPYDTGGRPAVVSMTSLYDVARFVAAAIEVGPERWPRELRMRGDRLAVTDVVSACITASQVPFHLINHEYHNIQAHLDWSVEHGDVDHWYYFQRLKAAAEGRYDFGADNLNEMIDHVDGVENVRPLGFHEWARRTWAEHHRSQLLQQQQDQGQMGEGAGAMQLG